MTVGVAVQAMLVGMSAPRDPHRSEADGQVLIAVGRAGHPARPGADRTAAIEPPLIEPDDGAEVTQPDFGSAVTEPATAEPAVANEAAGAAVTPLPSSARVAAGGDRSRYALEVLARLRDLPTAACILRSTPSPTRKAYDHRPDPRPAHQHAHEPTEPTRRLLADLGLSLSGKQVAGMVKGYRSLMSTGDRSTLLTVDSVCSLAHNSVVWSQC